MRDIVYLIEVCGVQSRRTFTSTGTWTKPAEFVYSTVIVTGGGGNGGIEGWGGGNSSGGTGTVEGWN